MDFFSQQDHALKQTRKLIFLFILAVIAIVLSVNIGMVLLWVWQSGPKTFKLANIPKVYFIVTTAVTLLFILGGSLIEILRLRNGGDAVAEMAGGRKVNPAICNGQERMLVNVVEEMALASGVACPNVYILEREQGINAFAAGYNPNSAVVAVTQGTLDHLSRDELQGVIGHEFSHILNGDMRLNIRLIGILYGIQMISNFGQEVMYWGSRTNDSKRSGFVLVVIGLGLFIIGYTGLIFGRMIKSAVSRQREFLADASAVQFTRHPDGIGSALRKIGGLRIDDENCGSRIENPNAEHFSHLFLGAANQNLMSGWFATHPPLEERIQRIYGRRMAFIQDPTSTLRGANVFAEHGQEQVMGFSQATLPNLPDLEFKLPTPPVNRRMSERDPTANQLPKSCVDGSRVPLSAAAICLALFIDENNEEIQTQQLNLIAKGSWLQPSEVTRWHAELKTQVARRKMELINRCTPSLRQLMPEQKQELLAWVKELILADRQFSRLEFVLHSILSSRLRENAGRAQSIKYMHFSQVKKEALLLAAVISSAYSSEFHRLSSYNRILKHWDDLLLTNREIHSNWDYLEVRVALKKCSQLAPLVKPKLIKALIDGALQDNRYNPEAVELIHAIAMAIDAPLPDVLNFLEN